MAILEGEAANALANESVELRNAPDPCPSMSLAATHQPQLIGLETQREIRKAELTAKLGVRRRGTIGATLL